MTNNYISRVELQGIHKRYDLDIDFNSSLNILYGKNGTGKSTLIHIIANIANCDFIRFAFLEFKKIKVTYSNGAYVVVTQRDEDRETLVVIETQSGAKLQFSRRDAYDAVRKHEDERYFQEFSPDLSAQQEFSPELSAKIEEFVKDNQIRHISTSYFPAFRTMLEAWAFQRDGRRAHPILRKKELSNEQTTRFARKLFGQFLPELNYPSPIDIELKLRDEIRDCQIRIARYESSIFSDSFVKVFATLLEDSNVGSSADELLSEISQLTEEFNTNKLGDFEENSNTYIELQRLVAQGSQFGYLQSSASGALTVYRDALKERQSFHQDAFKEIDAYFSVVNSFLEEKELAYTFIKNSRLPRVGLKFSDESWGSIKVMSSGERQLLTMLYAVNRMSGKSAVLIDEPEISLHIDWQEDLLDKMMEQLGERQIIVCTHSPAIAADFDEYMKEVKPIFNELSTEEPSLPCDESEDDF